MKDRLITLIGAAAAFLIVYVLFFGSGGEVEVTTPLSNEPGRNGYFALATWLEEQGVTVTSWRERFDLLAEPEPLTATGNVMLTTMPHRYEVRLTEQQALTAWIRRGNTLLIAAALNDSPEWAPQQAGQRFIESLSAMTGLRFAVETEEDSTLLVDADETVVLEPVPHPLMRNVATLAGLSDEPSSIWRAGPQDDFEQRPYFELATEQSHGVGALLQIPFEEGQVLLVTLGSLLTNHRIAESDAGAFIANVAAYHIGPGGTFIFDDMHHGLSTLYDPQAFYADNRLHATLAFLVAAWLIYIIGSSNRIAPAAPPRTEPRQADLLTAVGGFMARKLDRRDAGLMLFEDWFRELRRRRGIPESDDATWQALESTPTLSKTLLARLQDSYERLRDGQAVDLVQLHNLIRQARKAIG